MSTTTYGVNDTLTNKLWARGLSVEALKATQIAPLIGEGGDSVIQLRMETQRGPGDRITYGLRMLLTGDGVSEGTILEGNEEALTTYSQNILINELRHAVRVRNKGTIDQQRVGFNMRTEARDGLTDWFADRFSVSFFNQVCGYTVETDTKFTGFNSTVAPSTNRKIFAAAGASESNTADENLESDDVMDLRYIDYAKELATTKVSGRPPMRPVMVNGRKKFVLYIHPYQATDIRTSTDTGQWLDIQKAAMMGGQISNNPIFTDAIGEYHDVIIRVADDVSQGVNSSTAAAITTVRRAVLLGAQAATICFGKGYSEGSAYKWREEEFDYGHELGVSAGTCFGLQKNIFNSEDFGVVTISTYADAHS